MNPICTQCNTAQDPANDRTTLNGYGLCRVCQRAKDLPRPFRQANNNPATDGHIYGTYFPSSDLVVYEGGHRGTGKPGAAVEWLDEPAPTPPMQAVSVFSAMFFIPGLPTMPADAFAIAWEVFCKAGKEVGVTAFVSPQFYAKPFDNESLVDYSVRLASMAQNGLADMQAEIWSQKQPLALRVKLSTP